MKSNDDLIILAFVIGIPPISSYGTSIYILACLYPIYCCINNQVYHVAKEIDNLQNTNTISYHSQI